jgi:hypothetical protein
MKTGTAYIIGGLLILAWTVSGFGGGERQSWARKDFGSYQGNYMGMFTKSGHDHILVRNGDSMKSFQLREGGGPFRLPNIGGLMEVHHNQYNQVFSGRDTRPMYVPSSEAGREGLPTRQGIW